MKQALDRKLKVALHAGQSGPNTLDAEDYDKKGWLGPDLLICHYIPASDADAGFTLARGALDEVIAKLTTFPDAVAAGKIKVTGDAMRLGELMALMDEFPRMFEIVEPKRTPIA